MLIVLDRAVVEKDQAELKHYKDTTEQIEGESWDK